MKLRLKPSSKLECRCATNLHQAVALLQYRSDRQHSLFQEQPDWDAGRSTPHPHRYMLRFGADTAPSSKPMPTTHRSISWVNCLDLRLPPPRVVRRLRRHCRAILDVTTRRSGGQLRPPPEREVGMLRRATRHNCWARCPVGSTSSCCTARRGLFPALTQVAVCSDSHRGCGGCGHRLGHPRSRSRLHPGV